MQLHPYVRRTFAAYRNGTPNGVAYAIIETINPSVYYNRDDDSELIIEVNDGRYVRIVERYMDERHGIHFDTSEDVPFIYYIHGRQYKSPVDTTEFSERYDICQGANALL